MLSTHPLAGDLGYLLRRVQIAVFQDFRDSTAELRLRPAEYSVLLVLKQYPAMRQNRLAQMLAIKPANCAVLIDKLEKRGCVKREKLPVSGRAIALGITQAGEALLQQANRKVEKHRRRLRKRLGADGEQQLLRLLNRLLRSFRPGRTGGISLGARPGRE